MKVFTKELKSYRAIELSRGFSMIELLITITLLAMMAVVVSSYFGGVVGGIDLDSAADVIVSDLRNTQVLAMSGQDAEKWGICFRNPTSSDDLYEIVSPATACARDTAATVLQRTVFLPAGITFDTLGGDNFESVVFNKIDGTTTAATINISAQQGTKTITITAEGLISHN